MAYKPNETIMMHIHKTLQQKKEECLSLLRSTGRDKIEDLVTHVTRMGYFEAPGSLKHHRFVGGLLSHSLETYYKAMDLRDEKIRKGVSPDQMPSASPTTSGYSKAMHSSSMPKSMPRSIYRYNKQPKFDSFYFSQSQYSEQPFTIR